MQMIYCRKIMNENEVLYCIRCRHEFYPCSFCCIRNARMSSNESPKNS